MAQAILTTSSGFKVDLTVAKAFQRDVVARLPAGFELAGSQVAPGQAS